MPNPDTLSDKNIDASNESENVETIGIKNDEDSFNTEKLESQNSAENIRQSMQKYLHNKHEHLRRVSEQLVMNQNSDAKQNSPSNSSLDWQNVPTNTLTNPNLPPYPNPPKYNPVSNTSDLTQRQDLNRMSSSNRSPQGYSKYGNQNIVHGGLSQNNMMVEEQKGANHIQNLEGSGEREDEMEKENLFEKDGNSGYSCSGASSLSRDYKAERDAIDGWHQSDHNLVFDGGAHEKSKQKYGETFMLPAFARKSDSNLSKLVGEVESTEGCPQHLPAAPPMIVASRSHKPFIPHSRMNMPDPHPLLPNSTNHKGR